MKRKEENMKVLKIENNHGYFILGDTQNEIIDINKDNIFKLLNIIFENNDIVLDEITDKNQILNEAEKIVYAGIYEYFNNFILQKETIKREIDEEFSEIMNLLEKQDDENENGFYLTGKTGQAIVK